MQRMARGILEFILGQKDVVFHTEETETTFSSLDNFLYQYSNEPKGVIVYVKDEYFNPLVRHIKRTNPDKLKEIKIYDKIIGCKLENEQYKFKKTFYKLKFKLGTEDLDVNNATAHIKEIPNKSCQGYTSILRKQIKVSEELLDFTVGETAPSLSPMLYAKLNKEHINVKCFDITSFYPYLLTQELPHFDKIVDKKELDLTNKNFTYYGAIKIKDIKAKTPLCTLSLVGNPKGDIMPGQGIDILNLGTRLISAREITLFGFLPFLLNFLKEYHYNSYEISKKIARFKLEQDSDLRNLIIEKFRIKQEKKNAGLDYLGEKVLLNRIYGFFITKGNNSAAHYSQYVVQKGKYILLNIIKQIGLNDVVHSHTDSIKFIGNHEDVINAYNDTIEFSELGRFVHEGTMEKVVFYGINKAKYLMNNKLGFKHGGIDKKDIEPLLKMDYEKIDKDTDYNLTISYDYVSGKGFICHTIPKKFGQSLGGNEYETV